MNVSYSNSITDTVKNFRETIYCTEEFKKSFSDNLESTMNATMTSYVPEQFGGWSVSVTTNEKPISDKIESSRYVRVIADALASSVHSINKSISCRNLAANLANVVVTGPNSIVVKL